MAWAAVLAGSQSEIDAVIAWEYPFNYALGSVGVDPWRPDDDASRVLQEALTDVFGTNQPPHLHADAQEGHPASVLLAASEGADLLVVGSRGHSLLAGALLGSVSARCAEGAHCAVLVAHEPPRQVAARAS